jgi:hypothetical protein
MALAKIAEATTMVIAGRRFGRREPLASGPRCPGAYADGRQEHQRRHRAHARPDTFLYASPCLSSCRQSIGSPAHRIPRRACLRPTWGTPASLRAGQIGRYPDTPALFFTTAERAGRRRVLSAGPPSRDRHAAPVCVCRTVRLALVGPSSQERSWRHWVAL